ncbi:GNAT family N-acetyltransferase [Paenibacillus sanguinis]|uniref:GNAT family N-acetyltransferase n=1 Tax=Paenibacillus sanguinis TaxID=225906 RepID=UPI00037DBECF|nr:GNAT family N-acetyltransferase [Paenibacillus sanguinis]
MTELKERLRSEFPSLESDRLWLRRVVQEDSKALYDCLVDPSVQAFISFAHGKPLFPGRLYRYFEHSYQTLRDLHFAIEVKKEQRFIGLCSLQYWTEKESKARLGYLVSPVYRNRGYAAESVQSVLQFGFRTLGLGRIEADCSADNPASERVLQKCGLRYEGVRSAGIRQVAPGTSAEIRHYIVEPADYEML